MGSLVTRAIYPIPKASYEKGDFVGVDRIFSIKTPHYKKCKLLNNLCFYKLYMHV